MCSPIHESRTSSMVVVAQPASASSNRTRNRFIGTSWRCAPVVAPWRAPPRARSLPLRLPPRPDELRRCAAHLAEPSPLACARRSRKTRESHSSRCPGPGASSSSRRALRQFSLRPAPDESSIARPGRELVHQLNETRVLPRRDPARALLKLRTQRARPGIVPWNHRRRLRPVVVKQPGELTQQFLGALSRVLVESAPLAALGQVERRGHVRHALLQVLLGLLSLVRHGEPPQIVRLIWT